VSAADPQSRAAVTESAAHWDGFYDDRSPDDLPWHEPVPSTLAFVVANSSPSDSVIDVGGGASRLIVELADRGYADLTVLDLSPAALARSQERLGPRADEVSWIAADVTEFSPERRWSLWHDRAVFHFLVDAEDRRGYRAAAAAGVSPGGVLVVATFGLGGPSMCAGLPVCRYDCPSLAAEFAPDFELVAGEELGPQSSVGDQRPYVAVVLRRTD
jgi:SAM-dependent methyltransferase